MSKSGRAFLEQQERDFLRGELVNKKDAVLYVDVYCWCCKRLVAMSNTVLIDGRRFCYRCGEERR